MKYSKCIYHFFHKLKKAMFNIECSMHVSKGLKTFCFLFCGQILLILAFLPVYTYFSTYFIKTVCIKDECYKLPEHWMILYQIKNHQESFFGIEGLGDTNSSIDNHLILKNLQGTVYVSQDIGNRRDDFLKKRGYIYHDNKNCSYWKQTDKDNNIRFDKKRLEFSIIDGNEEIFQSIILMVCNPVKKLISEYK